jgi:hypothetical protein
MGRWLLCGLAALVLVVSTAAQDFRTNPQLQWKSRPQIPFAPLKQTVRLAGRTALNMLTCRDKQVCAEQWSMFLAGGMDAHSTDLYLKYCPTCLEENPIFGKRPSSARTWGSIMGFNFVMAMQSQGFHELARKHDNWAVGRVLPSLGSAAYVGIEIQATAVNYGVANRFKKCAQTVGCFYK